MGLDDDLSDDSGSILSIDNDLDFRSAVARQRATHRNQPRAKTKTVYLQLSGDKYRCNIRSDATWEQLKEAIESRLGLPPAVAQLASIRGARDGALIRTGNDVEDGEYLDLKLDLRELAQSKQTGQFASPRHHKDEQRNFHDDYVMPNLSTKSWVQSTNPKSISTRCIIQPSHNRHDTNKNPRIKKKVTSGNLSCVSPWVQAASGTTILAPVITSTKPPNKNRPCSAPNSRKPSENQQHFDHNVDESGSPMNNHRIQGGSWSRIGHPNSQDQNHYSKYLPHVNSTVDHARDGGGGGGGGGTIRQNINPTKSRVRPSSAPNVRSVVAGVHPVMPVAYGATEVMSGVFANPMDPRQRQQFLQMGEYENQRDNRLNMAQKLMNADQPPNTPKSNSKNKQQEFNHHHQRNQLKSHQQSSTKKNSSNKPSYGGIGGSVFFNKVNHRNHANLQQRGDGGQERQQKKQQQPLKQPWLPTRNCNHRSAIISEEYPMMSHDGVGGPSATRSERY